MRLGIISDAHGNTIALKQCLQHLKTNAKVEEIYFLGDAVGYFPDANGVIDLLRANQVDCIKGNHDAMLLGELELNPKKNEVYQLTQVLETITPENLNFISNWPAELKLNKDGMRMLLVHGSPNEPTTEYVYPDSDLSKWNDIDSDVVLMGHTHRAFKKTEGNTIFINAGSCGMPRDIGNSFSMVIVDTEARTAEIERIELNVAEMQVAYSTAHSSAIECLNRR